jgi:hypothetical protein
VDRVAEAAAELGPVLELLDPVQEQARQIRAEAAGEAERVRRLAEATATQRLADARDLAPEWRRQAAAEAAERAQLEVTAERVAATRRAAAIKGRADQRLPEYVNRVVALVLASAPRDPR